MFLALLAAAALAAGGASPSPAMTPAAPATTTSSAPDFDYQAADDRWTSLHEMRAGRAVMLVFAPDPVTLAELEADRAALERRGITPVAVLDEPDGRAWRLAVRLGLHYSLLSDPRGTVAEAFGRWDGAHATQGWCLVGHDGAVVAAGAGAHTAAELVATATGLAGEAVPPTAAE